MFIFNGLQNLMPSLAQTFIWMSASTQKVERKSVVAFHCSEQEQNDLRVSAAVKCVGVKHTKNKL